MSLIHPTAIVDPDAKLGKNVQVGAYSIIGKNVEIGEDSWIGPHVVLNGPTKLGERNKIFQFASVGEACQDKKYNNEPTELIVGDDNVFREFTTIQRGTVQDNSRTVIGSRNLFMAYVHVAHDCIVGNDTVMANQSTLAGHVKIGDHTILGGNVMIHQFCQIGAHCMIGISSIIVKDVPDFLTCMGTPTVPKGMNFEGLKRRGFDKDDMRLLKRAYRIVYREGHTLSEAIEELNYDEKSNQYVDQFVESLQRSTRGIIR